METGFPENGINFGCCCPTLMVSMIVLVFQGIGGGGLESGFGCAAGTQKHRPTSTPKMIRKY